MLLLLLQLPLFIFAIVGADLSSFGQGSESSQCATPKCNDISSQIFGMLNTSADPCDNPHFYFCGNWMKSFVLPKDESSWTSSFSTLQNNTREHLRRILDDESCLDITVNEKEPYDAMLSCYYHACMDTDRSDLLGAEPLLTVMKSSLPFLVERILKPQSIEDESRLNNDEKVKLLSKRLAQLLDLGVTGYFLLSVEPSVLSKSGNYALYLSEGGLSLPYRRYEQSDSTDAYLDYISKLLAAFSADVRGIKDKRIGEIEDDAKQRAAEVLKMEQDMKSISLTPEQKRDKKLTTNLKPYDEMQKALSGALDLTIVLEPFLRLASNASNEDKSYLIVDNPAFMGSLASLIQTRWTWGAIHDYLLVKVIRSFSGRLSKKYRDINDEFQLRMLGSTPLPRWRKCQESVTDGLGWILSLRYIRSIKQSQRRKEIAKNMVKMLKEIYSDVIENVRWMDEETKGAALNKLNATGYKLAFPDWLSFDHATYFMRYYGEPNIIVMRDYVKALIHISKQRARFHMSRLGAPKDTTEWSMYPFQVNAYFQPVLNEIVFPLSIMQEPFLYVWTECNDAEKTLSRSECSSREEKAFMQLLSFGGLGSVVGHELTHGFDDQGRQFDEKGQLVDWWTPASSKAFEKEAQCILNQYGNYSLRLNRPSRNGVRQEWKLEEIPVSGKLTLGENIADNGGIKLAYLAIRSLHPEYFTTQVVAKPLSDLGFTSASLFSASFAQIWCDVAREKAILSGITSDPHSPKPFRIIGTLTNFKIYSDAFKCPQGSRVNPKSSKQETVSGIEPVDQFEAYRRSMLENPLQIMESDFDTIIFDPLNVVASNIAHRCEVW